MEFPPGVAYLNGDYTPISEAKISVLDWGFLRSDATYDVVHVWQGRFFRLDVHLDRFYASAAKIHLDVPVAREELARILAGCVDRSGLDDAYVEMIVTRGVSPTFSRDPRDAVPQLICFAIPLGWILKPEDRETGLSIAVSDIRRIPPNSVDPTVKNYHWLDLVMGLYDAYERGAENVVLTDAGGNLTEGPGFNIFIVKDGEIATPDSGVLEGITRRTAMELAGELGMPVERCPVPLETALKADEVFATSTAGGIMPITRINGDPVGSGEMGPVTRSLIDAYWQRHTDPNWSTAVRALAQTGSSLTESPD